MLIAAFKLFKGLALLAVALGMHHLLHRNLAEEAQYWVDLLRVDPHNHYIHRLLEKVSSVDARKLRELSIGTFFYAALFLTEGIGLATRQRWAEYLTIISTASFIPLEIYEVSKHPSIGKVVLVLANIAIVIYLVYELRRSRKSA
jgi:uncharacterized membrane protein (DUF2068 family)